MNRPERLCLIVVAAIHTLHFAWTAVVPGLADLYILDSRVYDAMANDFLAQGFFAGDEAFGHAPLYPLWLAALRFVGLDAALFPLALQVGLGILNAGLVGGLARRIFGGPAAAPAIVLYGLYGPAAMLETKLMATTLGVSLLLVALWLLVRDEGEASRRRFLVAGLVLGAACLVRPNLLLFVPLAALFVVHRAGGLRSAAAWGWGFAFGLAVVLAIAPVSIRNHLVSGERVWITAHGGMTLYQSNNPNATGIYSRIPGAVGNPLVLADRLRERAEAEHGGPLTLGEVDRSYRDRALAFLREDPRAAAALVMRKLRFWFGNDEVSTEYSLATERELTPSLWLMPIPFALVLALAVFGAFECVCSRGASPSIALLGAFVATNLATVAIFYFSSRYRVPAVAVLCVFAGAGVARVIECVARRGETVTPASWGGLLLACAFAVLSLLPLSDDAERYAFHQWFNYGVAQDERGEHEVAVASFERALVGMRDHWHVHLALGRAYAKVDRLDEALARYRRAVELRPQSRDAREGVREVRARIEARKGP